MLHIASAMIAKSGIIITSRECEYEKSCKISLFREMIRELDVKDALIVADALHCKTKSAEIVVENGAYYFLSKR